MAEQPRAEDTAMSQQALDGTVEPGKRPRRRRVAAWWWAASTWLGRRRVLGALVALAILLTLVALGRCLLTAPAATQTGPPATRTATVAPAAGPAVGSPPAAPAAASPAVFARSEVSGTAAAPPTPAATPAPSQPGGVAFGVPSPKSTAPPVGAPPAGRPAAPTATARAVAPRPAVGGATPGPEDAVPETPAEAGAETPASAVGQAETPPSTALAPAAETPGPIPSATLPSTPPTAAVVAATASRTPNATPTATATASSSGGGSSATATPVPVFSITTPGSAGAVLSRANLVPGDAWSYDLVVRNDGTLDYSYFLTVTPEVGSGLDDPGSIGEPVDRGLQLRITRCDAAFATCGGALYDGPVIVSLCPLGSIPAGADDRLRLNLRLPDASGNTFQGLTSILALTWTATSS